MVHALIDLTPALFVDEVAHLVVPDIMVRFYSDDTTIIVELQRLPQRRAVLHLVGPGHMMEPQQQILWTRLYIIISTCEVLAILAGSICSLAGTLEAYALLVGLVVIDRAPLQWIALDEAIGFWTVVVVELENMV